MNLLALIPGPIKRGIAAVGALLVALFVARKTGKSKGKEEAYDEMQEQDRARADGVRERAGSVSVQPSDIKYRD